MGVDLETFKRIFAQVEEVAGSLLDIEAQEGVDHTVPNIDAENEDYVREDWDGQAAVASYPDAEDADLTPNFALIPEDPEDRDAKANFALPFRNSHEGTVNLQAVIAAIAAVNGARGGVEGVEQEALRDAYNLLVELGVEGGLYEEPTDAPEFAAGTYTDGDEEETEDEPEEPEEPEIDARKARIDDGVELSAQNEGDGLTGVVWAAGRHVAHIDGEPTEIVVPPETIPETYEELQAAVESDEPPTIGTDHYGSLTQAEVAEDLGLLELAEAEGFAMSDDETEIVLTDSRFTNEEARKAFQDGGFDGKSFSLHGRVEVINNDGDALEVAARDIERIDVVEEGAVEDAKIGNVPADVAALAAQAAEGGSVSDAIDIIAGYAEDGDGGSGYATEKTETNNETEQQNKRNRNMSNDDDIDKNDFESVEAALQAASSKLEEKDERIEELRAEKSDLEDKVGDVETLEERAGAYEDIAAAVGKDPEDAETEEIVDELTRDIRAEIAELEARLPAKETTDEDIDDRVEELSGSSPRELRATRGDLANQVLKTEEARENYNKAVAAEEGSTSGTSEEADDIAEGALGTKDLLQAKDADKSPAEFMQDKYDVEPSEFDNEIDAREAVLEAKAGEKTGA